MEAQDLGSTEKITPQTLSCSECLERITKSILTLAGSPLCDECASTYYGPCATCGGLVPQEELLSRDSLQYCNNCFTRATLPPDIEPITEGEIESLITEYVELNAESKKITDRLDEIKERIKAAASARQRVSNAVILRAGDLSVRCGYSIKLKCDPGRTAELENVLGSKQFTMLFEKRVTFNPNKENLEEFLTGSGDQELKKAVRGAIETTEVVALTVPRSKKK